MAAWLDTVFQGFDMGIFSAMHALAEAAGESIGADVSSLLTHFMHLVSLLAHDGIGMLLLGLVLMAFRRTRKIGVCVFAAVCCGAVITNLTLKPLLSRIRPYANMEHLGETVREWWIMVGEARKGDSIDSSFPSGHTTAATAAMVGLFLSTNKKKFWPVLLFPFLMGASRIYLMVHYPSDVLAGLLAGMLGAIAAYFITKGIFAWLNKNTEKALCRFALHFDIVEWLKNLKKTANGAEN
jgi:undecaprenyl-diphosphatase